MPKDRVIKWAEGIKNHEGWFTGSRSFRNNNPGNFKYGPLMRSYGATGEDIGGFAKFPSYEKGWNALVNFLKEARRNNLIAYRQIAIDRKRPGNIPTLADFFDVYAPSSDDNDPKAYAKSVASYIGDGVTVDTPVSQI